jgi:uncharacterized membrane protein YoaT (DUF817 family)
VLAFAGYEILLSSTADIDNDSIWGVIYPFFTHHFIGNHRWYLTTFDLGLYIRTTWEFTPYDRPRRMPILLAFTLVGFFIWLAENIGTFFGIRQYPNQIAFTSVNGEFGHC